MQAKNLVLLSPNISNFVTIFSPESVGYPKCGAFTLRVTTFSSKEQVILLGLNIFIYFAYENSETANSSLNFLHYSN